MNKDKKSFVFLIFAIIFTHLPHVVYSSDNPQNCTEKRAVFDFGSGALKAEAILFDKCINKQITKLGEHVAPNKLSKCIINSGNDTLSEKCITESINIINNIESKLSLDCKSDKCLGIATAWARKAKNSSALIEAIAKKNIKIEILSQETEGEYGFHAAVQQYIQSLSNKEQYANINLDELARNFIVFDIGGGSYQLSYLDKDNKIHVHKGKYGVESFDYLLREKLQYSEKQEYPYFDTNLLNKAVNIATTELGSELKYDTKITNTIHTFQNDSNELTSVIGIGSVFNVAVHSEMQLPAFVTRNEILLAAQKFTKQTISSLNKNIFPKLKPEFITTAQTSLITIYGIMNSTGMDELHIVDAHITDYIMSNAKFWH